LFAVVTSALAVLISMCPDAGLADSAEDKRPVPSEAEQAEPLKLLREIFGSQYAAAKTAEDRQALAREILQRSAEVEDPVNRYVMLRVAKDIAVQAAAADLIVETIDRIADRYQFDAVEAKLHAMTKAARHAETETQHVRLAQQAMAAFEEAVAADRFDAAMQLVELGADAARAAERWDLTRQIVALGREIDSLAEAYQDVQDDIARLESDSLDPEANLSVGRFWCLYKGDWKRGLPLLALGSDSQLAKLAEDELSEPRLAKHQLALADGWWDLAESNEGRPQEQCRRRAALWYRAAMSGLSGIQREKAKRRLAEIGTRAEQTANPTPAPGTQPAKLADALVGMYQVLATERKGNGKGRFKLHLGADRSAAIEGQTVGSWRVEGLRAYIDFDDPGTRPRPTPGQPGEVARRHLDVGPQAAARGEYLEPPRQVRTHQPHDAVVERANRRSRRPVDLAAQRPHARAQVVQRLY
jgi:hypothetical protein